MNRKAFIPLLFGVCLLGAPLALGACGGEALLMGTETGNPPDVDMRRLRLEWTESGVELIGEAGAVPAGAEVRLRNTRTGESASGTANADGSIRLSVQGTLSDAYEVTVLSGGGQTTEPLSATMPGSTLDDGALPGGMPACASLELELNQAVATTFAEAPHECSAHRDCTTLGWGVGCHTGCGVSAIASSSAEATRALADQRVGPICAELAGCERLGPSCDLEPSFAFCIEGGCEARYVSQVSCSELSNEAGARRIEAMEHGDRACNVDADCVIVDLSVRCYNDCPRPHAVLSSAVQAVQNEVERVESEFCGEHEAADCPLPPSPGCPAPAEGVPTAQCLNGRCEVTLATSIP